MEGKSGFFVLIGIVAFLSLSLALLAGYVFFIQDKNPELPAESPGIEQIVVPKEDEIIRELLFAEKLPFNLKNDDSQKTPVIVVSVEVWYYKKVKGIKETSLKVTGNKSKLQEIVGTYFQGLSISDVIGADAKEKARNELTKKMNEFLLSNEKEKNDIVYSVVFDHWFYQ